MKDVAHWKNQNFVSKYDVTWFLPKKVLGYSILSQWLDGLPILWWCEMQIIIVGEICIFGDKALVGVGVFFGIYCIG